LKNLFFVFVVVVIFSACSLKYTDTVEVESRVPEFVFEGTTMTRYEDRKVTLQMHAEVLEQYKGSSETYAKNISFSAYDDGELSTEGSCGLLYSDTDKDLYELYDDIEIFNHKDKINFFANVLKWNAKNEQLTSGRGDIVKIEKDDTVIRGSGFSASGISKSFSFRGNVTGDIETSDDENEENN